MTPENQNPATPDPSTTVSWFAKRKALHLALHDLFVLILSRMTDGAPLHAPVTPLQGIHAPLSAREIKPGYVVPTWNSINLFEALPKLELNDLQLRHLLEDAERFVTSVKALPRHKEQLYTNMSATAKQLIGSLGS